MKHLYLLLVFCCGYTVAYAQVGINTTTPSSAAQLHLEAKHFNTIAFGGFLMPVVTQDEQLSIPVSDIDDRDDGIMVYVSDDVIKKYCWDVYDSTTKVWRSIHCITVSSTNTLAPGIALVKTGVFNDENNDDAAQVAETISYTFRVFNTGNEALFNVVVNDPLLGGNIAGPLSGDTNGNSALDINEVWVYTANYAVNSTNVSNGFVTNQATVVAENSLSTVVSDLSDDDSQFQNEQTVVILPEETLAVCDTTLYSEDFSGYTAMTGRNRRVNSGDYPLGVTWVIDDSGADALGQDNDYAYTNASNEFELDNTDGPIILTFAAVNISAYETVCFSVDVRGTGDLEYNPSKHIDEGTIYDDENDYINIEYSTDGGSNFTLIQNYNGYGNANHTVIADFPDSTVSVDNLSGTSLIIRITSQVWENSETYYYDNILVEGGN